MITIGIDPGKNGGLAIITNTGDLLLIVDFSKNTITDILEDIQAANYEGENKFAYLEKVHTIQPAGKVPNFKLGESFGMIKGILTALKIPFELVTPQKWQQAMGCMSKGDKNITKVKAQQLFPDIKITHNIADALLIAEYGRRTRTK